MRQFTSAFLILAAATIAAVQDTRAQLQTRLALSSSYDDNAFRAAAAQAEYITSAALSLDYQPEESRFRFFASGNVGLFKEFSDRRYFANSLGLSYQSAFGEDEQNSWSSSISYFRRVNREQYNFYDFGQFLGSVSLKYYLDYESGLLGRTGYRLRYRGYANLSEFSYTEHFGFVQVSKFFETKTTLLGEIDLGNKNYTSSSVMPSTSGTAGGLMSGSGMMGYGMGGRWQNGNTSVLYDTPGTTQFIGIVRLAQSVTASTGASVQYLRRINISERARFLSNGAVDYQEDTELWDDPYGYQGHEYNLTLTQLLPWEMTLRGSVDYLQNNYSRSIYLPTDSGLPTGPSRRDTRLVGGLELIKSFGSGWTIFHDLSISISYFYQRNSSNDPYYDFNHNAFGFSIITEL